jgi:hypothetical protein
VEPNVPAGQLVQTPEPAVAYVPAAHWVVVAEVDPAGQAYPAVHAPVHWLVVAPAAPYRPGSQAPAQGMHRTHKTNWAPRAWRQVPGDTYDVRLAHVRCRGADATRRAR